jgi:hypothetical protein
VLGTVVFVATLELHGSVADARGFHLHTIVGWTGKLFIDWLFLYFFCQYCGMIYEEIARSRGAVRQPGFPTGFKLRRLVRCDTKNLVCVTLTLLWACGVVTKEYLWVTTTA